MTWQVRRILVLGGLSIWAAGCSRGVAWRSDWERAFAEARHDQQHTLLMFSAGLCTRCWRMDRDVFDQPEVKKELAYYKLVRLDMLTNAKMAKSYEFTGTPSFVIFNSVGRPVGTHAGAMDAAGLIRFLRKSRIGR